MEIKQNNVFSSVDCWWLGRLLVALKSQLHSVLALKRAGFSLAVLQVAGHSSWYCGQVYLQRTHVPASVHKFCSQRNWHRSAYE